MKKGTNRNLNNVLRGYCDSSKFILHFVEKFPWQEDSTNQTNRISAFGLRNTLINFISLRTGNIVKKIFNRYSIKVYEEPCRDLPAEKFEGKLIRKLKRSGISLHRGGIYFPPLRNVWLNDNRNSIDSILERTINLTTMILVPYRQRLENLMYFLDYMHHYLPLKLPSYQIILLQQEGNKPFNRAKLFNAGLMELGGTKGETLQKYHGNNKTIYIDTDCYALHDVDKIPANFHIAYRCLKNVTQLVRRPVSPYPADPIKEKSVRVMHRRKEFS